MSRYYSEENVYRIHTKLHDILNDGWGRGFLSKQTIREASRAGYSNCVVIPELQKVWNRLDDEYEQDCKREVAPYIEDKI